MVKDCMDYAQRCQACQFHVNFIHQPPEPLHPIIASWPFDAWALEVVGPMTKLSAEHLYILAATDYFSKWAEAIPLKEAKKENCDRQAVTKIWLQSKEVLDVLCCYKQLKCYQARLYRVFNKKVSSRSFQIGDLVLAVRRPIIITYRTENKFTSMWDGLYVVKEAYINGSYKLIAKDGLRIGPINGKFLKRYYA
ncbi:hypothetical protein CDL12_23464 [Handroanthus impetiginosus]|uniref:Integrase catalytic domain-containing protein n=1 Tax=Handroanthus impetiginosus TaxID=429701 RepID=A0A2G9GFD4_9LAMI|nr:hypothetical protein CDL12_23464 [Handroanthus impetiginosus]